MPYTKFTFRPGIDEEQTPTLNEGGWSDGSLIRFRSGQAQTMGGWVPATPQKLVGTCRQTHTWSQLDGQVVAAFGTSVQLALLKGGVLFDITPIRASGTLPADPFSMSAGTLTVTHPTNALDVGDQVVFSTTAVGSFLVSGQYTVASIIDSNTYTIAFDTSTGTVPVAATGGAGVTYTYLLPVGNSNAQNAFGWGAGAWGAGTWGTPRSSGSKAFPPRIWSIDNWGEEMVALVRGVNGGVYNWRPAQGTSTRAAAIPGAPQVGNALLSGMPERHLIVFGADVGGIQDPLLVRFSDTEDYTVWAASATNAAGSFRLQGGTKIMAAVSAAGQILILTDSLLYGMRYEGLPYVYRFDVLGQNCGAISPNAMVALNSTAWWMSPDGFFVYNGQTQSMNCSVWTHVFTDLNQKQQDKIVAGLNSQFNEVRWDYPSAGATENDRYVIYNYLGDIWYIGQINRTDWEDAPVFSTPLATDSDGNIFYQEVGTDAAGSAMPTTLTSGYFDLVDGQDFAFLDSIIPDIQVTGRAQITINAQNTPGGAVTSYGPYQVTSTTKEIPLRLRARQISLTISSNTVGTSWKLGAMRFRVRADGRR